MSKLTKPNKIEIINLTNLTIIKYHLSDYQTAIMTIKNGKASFEIRTYGSSVHQDEPMGPVTGPGENLRPGQIWKVRLKDKEGIITVKVTDLGYRGKAVITLASMEGKKWKAGYLIDDVEWVERF